MTFAPALACATLSRPLVHLGCHLGRFGGFVAQLCFTVTVVALGPRCSHSLSQLLLSSWSVPAIQTWKFQDKPDAGPASKECPPRTCLSLGFPIVKTSSPGTLDLRPKGIGPCAECSLSFLSVFLLLQPHFPVIFKFQILGFLGYSFALIPILALLCGRCLASFSVAPPAQKPEKQVISSGILPGSCSHPVSECEFGV